MFFPWFNDTTPSHHSRSSRVRVLVLERILKYTQCTSSETKCRFNYAHYRIELFEATIDGRPTLTSNVFWQLRDLDILLFVSGNNGISRVMPFFFSFFFSSRPCFCVFQSSTFRVQKKFRLCCLLTIGLKKKMIDMTLFLHFFS